MQVTPSSIAVKTALHFNYRWRPDPEAESAPLVARVAIDISDQLAYEKEMSDLAYYDTLTRLPSRRLFDKRLRQAIEGRTVFGSEWI